MIEVPCLFGDVLACCLATLSFINDKIMFPSALIGCDMVIASSKLFMHLKEPHFDLRSIIVICYEIFQSLAKPSSEVNLMALWGESDAFSALQRRGFCWLVGLGDRYMMMLQ